MLIVEVDDYFPARGTIWFPVDIQTFRDLSSHFSYFYKGQDFKAQDQRKKR